MHPSPTVLIVEDEPTIRMFEAAVLEDAGYRSIEAGDAEQALEKLAGPGDVDIVLTDIRLPGAMDGLQLASAIRDRWPDTAIVIASSEVERIASRERRDVGVVAKPFTGDELITAMDEALSEALSEAPSSDGNSPDRRGADRR